MLSLLAFVSLLLFSPPSYSKPPHLDQMRKWVGFEETGQNRGVFFDKLNRAAGNPLGSPYCAATVSMALKMGGATTPTYRGGLATRYRESGSLTARDVLRGKATLQPGDLAIWQKGETIFGHIGVIERVVDRRTIVVIEGNTSPGTAGRQDDGDGIWRRTRHIEMYNYFKIRWFTRPSYG